MQLTTVRYSEELISLRFAHFTKCCTILSATLPTS